jgi:Kef-type K+ transport system membrane component KefB
MEKNFLATLFAKISDVINGADKSLLDLLSAVVPYLVPVIPAYLTYYHTRDQMQFPEGVAWTAAFVVEVLGMTSISTAIRFYRNNRRYKNEGQRAPFTLAIVTYVFYLVVVLSVNVLLEVDAAQRRPVIILAIALFSLLSIPAGVLISIRSEYASILEERQVKRAERGGVTVFPYENIHAPTLSKECAVCGKAYKTTSDKQRFCSNACRQKHHRNKLRDAS